MNRTLYLRKIKNLRDQVDMLLMESRPQRLLELSGTEIGVTLDAIQQILLPLKERLEVAFKTGDVGAFNEAKEYINDIIGDRTEIEKDIDSFCERVQTSSSVTAETKKLLTPVILKQHNTLDKNLDKLIADKDGNASGTALAIFYTAGLECIIVSFIMGMLIKPDLKGDISKIKGAFRNKEWLKLLELVAKDLFRYGIIALPAIMGLVLILIAVLEQFSDYKVISAVCLFMKRKFIAPLLILARDLAHE